jgi:hypothetical protein
MQFQQVIIRTYPNKYKAQNPKAPDIKGEVEVTLRDGTIETYDYAQWKPAPGKKQTLTKWAMKRDQADHRGDPTEEHPEERQQPAQPQQYTPPPPPPPVDDGKWH